MLGSGRRGVYCGGVEIAVGGGGEEKRVSFFGSGIWFIKEIRYWASTRVMVISGARFV